MPILNWLTRDEDIQATKKVPYRLLEEVPELSYGDKGSGNMLIQGDNLEALKSLLPFYAGQVKCIYIDPPYNTKSAFEHYDDNLEHSQWLAMMYPRLEILKQLLTHENGTLLISINDDEAHYLKVMCDEVFGRSGFVGSFVWHYEGNTDNQADIINYHEYVLVYSTTGEIDPPGVIDPNIPKTSKLYKTEIRNTIVKNGPKNPVSEIKLPIGFPASFEEGIIEKTSMTWPKLSGDILVDNWKTQTDIVASSGWSSKKILEDFIRAKYKSVLDSKGQKTSFVLTQTGAIEAVKKREQNKGHVVSVLRGFGTTNQMRLLLEKIGVKFTYPKPVDLISYLISIFSCAGDLVLDSFAGSGTTGHAVAQLNLNDEENRRYILVELDNHNADNTIVTRLKKVIEGCAESGIKKHGGGFRFYRLGLKAFDEDGRICPDIRFTVLAGHVWFSETSTPWNGNGDSPVLGIEDGKGYALLYNGILGDKRPDGGNVLTSKTLQIVRDDMAQIDNDFSGPLVIYGESCRMGEARLKREYVIFKQTPYDVKAR